MAEDAVMDDPEEAKHQKAGDEAEKLWPESEHQTGEVGDRAWWELGQCDLQAEQVRLALPSLRGARSTSYVPSLRVATSGVFAAALYGKACTRNLRAWLEDPPSTRFTSSRSSEREWLASLMLS